MREEKKNAMHFFMPMEKPPTATAQERKVTKQGGRVLFYDTPEIQDAKSLLISSLYPHRPEKPIKCGVHLITVWMFPAGEKHKDGKWRTSKPDTDNLQKMLKDCMTQVGFWEDDALVCWESVQKRWSKGKTGIYIEIRRLGETVEDGEES